MNESYVFRLLIRIRNIKQDSIYSNILIAFFLNNNKKRQRKKTNQRDGRIRKEAIEHQGYFNGSSIYILIQIFDGNQNTNDRTPWICTPIFLSKRSHWVYWSFAISESKWYNTCFQQIISISKNEFNRLRDDNLLFYS